MKYTTWIPVENCKWAAVHDLDTTDVPYAIPLAGVVIMTINGQPVKATILGCEMFGYSDGMMLGGIEVPLDVVVHEVCFPATKEGDGA